MSFYSAAWIEDLGPILKIFFFAKKIGEKIVFLTQNKAKL
jgi:hypothetical protein